MRFLRIAVLERNAGDALEHRHQRRRAMKRVQRRRVRHDPRVADRAGLAQKRDRLADGVGREAACLRDHLVEQRLRKELRKEHETVALAVGARERVLVEARDELLQLAFARLGLQHALRFSHPAGIEADKKVA